MPSMRRSIHCSFILAGAILLLVLTDPASAQQSCAKILCAEGYEPVTDANGCDHACRPVAPANDCVAACTDQGLKGRELGACVGLCQALSMNLDERGISGRVADICVPLARLTYLK